MVRLIAGKDISKLVADREWQSLRQSLVGTWRSNTVSNVGLLRKYLGDFSDAKRVLRVLNYLTGTTFRSGTIRHTSIDKLLTRLRKEHSRIKGK